MQEKLIHFIWQNLLFNTQHLYTTDNESIQIIHKGTINTHSGPDFTNAKLKIAETIWAGEIEIHYKSSEWKIHKHGLDEAYDSTILHVCWEFDEPSYRTNGTKISCLALKNLVNEKVLNTYQFLIQTASPIPCHSMLNTIDEFTWIFWQERLIIERLEQKLASITLSLEQHKYNWQEVFYHSLAQTFGLKINTPPFGILASNLPLKILSKHKNNLEQIEALLFGVSGFLEEPFTDDYCKRLQKEYHFLKQKYQLIEQQKSNWKFLRLMPANFPTLRLAQFAMLIHQSNHLFSKLIEERDSENLSSLLQVTPSSYWDTHYMLDELSTKRIKRLGQATIHNIIINTIVPFKFAYGKYKDIEDLKQNALDLLISTKPETNSIVKNWAILGVKAKNSLQSQALLQLKNEYCTKKRCLSCAIGAKVLKNETA